MSMPKQKPGKSFQSYATPWEFIRAVEGRFGPIVCDLAAAPSNAKAKRFYGPSDDSLTKEWAADYPEGLLWLNPPFAKIGKWAAKCATESAKRSGGHIVMLVPASIGTDWFALSVEREAHVIALSPRMIFDGAPINPKTGKPDGYPKDLMLVVYTCGLTGFSTWRWKE